MAKQLDITTALDLCGLGLVAAGTGAGLWPLIGAFGLIPAGAVVIVSSWLAARGK